eukprot:5586991-Amphidinium_carterae.1
MWWLLPAFIHAPKIAAHTQRANCSLRWAGSSPPHSEGRCKTKRKMHQKVRMIISSVQGSAKVLDSITE